MQVGLWQESKMRVHPQHCFIPDESARPWPIVPRQVAKEEPAGQQGSRCMQRC